MFGDNLKRICNDRGTTPTALCKTLGWSTSKVSAWYSGSLPKQDDLATLAQRLNCSVADFFLEKTGTDIPVETPGLSVDEADLVRIYQKLPRRQQHKLLAFAYDLEESVGLEGDSASHAAG